MNLRQACETMKASEYRARIPKMIKWLHGELNDMDKAYIEFEWFQDKEEAVEVVKEFMTFSNTDLCTITNDWKKLRVEKDEFWEKEQVQRSKN